MRKALREVIETTLRAHRVHVSRETLRYLSNMIANDVERQGWTEIPDCIDAIRWRINAILHGLPRAPLV